MKSLPLLATAVLLSASTSFAVARLCPCAHAIRASAPSPSGEGLAQVERALAEAQSRESALADEVRKLRGEISGRASGEARVPEGEIEAAVSRALARQADAEGSGESRASAAKGPAPKRFDARAALQDLLTPGLSREEKHAKWKAIAAAGALDEVVAMFEEYAKDHADSPGAQVELGAAYLQKVFQAGNGPEAGVWAVKADEAFDAALSIDERCWDARFSKAVSLSFWPPVFGKQSEAIRNFEILTEQQGQGSSDPKFAQTWLLLGNLYQQIGKSDQALAAWQKGLAIFPDNAQLAQQIANAQGH
jgi:tetratricopeptide (TPR) repeat protein